MGPNEVGPYRLEDRVGVGGQGTVFVGRKDAGPRVAVKLLHPHLVADRQAHARFLGEVELAKRVAPFCTAQVLDSGVVDDVPYIVSEFVEGPSLQRSVRDSGPRSGAALERLAINTAAALAAIHAAEVIHRDFKPGNVLLGPDGPVVIDFGISRALDLSRSVMTSQIVGTPAYMAPEQHLGDDAGAAADLFAWGATMVYAATGERAFPGESFSEIKRQILNDEPDLGALDDRLASIVRACLAKDPARRPTAAQVVEYLRSPRTHVFQGGGPTLPDAPVDRSAAEGRGRRRLLLGAGALSLLVASAIAYPIAFPDQGRGDVSASRGQGPGPSGSPGPTSTGTGEDGEAGSRSRSSSGAPGTGGPESTPSPDGGGEPRRSRPPAPKKSPPPSGGGGGQKPPSGPRTLGTVDGTDVDAYCKSRGYGGSGQQYDGSYYCAGTGLHWVSLTSVCRWRYPGHPNVRAEGNVCKSS
ncbi:serine/threonine protein kinase [Thermomonospora umbrina]|nr:serine/threonine-protein kinase [Thermomonospora umbrina]